MTATATMLRTDRPRTRTTELVLAHAHLRLGALALARVELETMATLGILDDQGLVDLAEVRWRTGDLTGAGEVATASLRGEVDDPVALVIAAEAAASAGRPGEARRYAQRAMAMAGGTIDAIFAGMPRSVVWPPDADEPPPSAPTLFDRGPDIAPLETREPAPPDPTPAAAAAAAAAKPPTGPMTLGFWDDDETVDPGPAGLPDPAAALEAGRAALVAGSPEVAALHFSLALRLAPALAPAILEATGGARSPAVSIVRGDAYRAAGHELEARNAYAEAARGGPPERRKKARVKEAPPVAASLDDADEDADADEDDRPDGADGADGAPDAAVDPSAAHSAVDPGDATIEPATDAADDAAEADEATTDGDPIA
jgi:tetratricopeptide (TPR) repeat protein